MQIRIKIQEVLKAVCFVVILRCVVQENFHTHPMGGGLRGRSWPCLQISFKEGVKLNWSFQMDVSSNQLPLIGSMGIQSGPIHSRKKYLIE